MNQKLFYSLVIICTFLTAQSQTANLVAQYDFSNGSLNAQFGGVNGSGHNIYASPDRFGNKNEAIELRRTQNSTVSFGDNFDHIFTGNSAKFSFSFWFKNGDLANSNASFITKYSGSDCGEDGREFGIRINSSKKIELLYFMSLQNGSYRGYEGHTAVNDTNWHHVVVSYNATINTNNGKDRVQIYLDTIPQNLSLTISQGSSLSYIQDGSAHFGLGAPLTSAGGKCFSGNTYHGYMDDILIYSRNINSSEVAALYNDTSSICSNIGMKDAVQTSILSLYPNPTHNYFTIEMIDNQTFKSVIIMDQTGKIIGQEVGTFIGSHTVNTTNLSSGIYTVLVQTGNNKIARLLVKE